MKSLNFDRLAAIVERIAHHPEYPDKRQAVEHCIEDVGDLCRSGRITAAQEETLREMLSGGCSPP